MPDCYSTGTIGDFWTHDVLSDQNQGTMVKKTVRQASEAGFTVTVLSS